MKIYCSVCGATAYARPDQPQGVVLRRVVAAGEKTWFCEAHVPAGARSAPPKSPASTPVELLDEVERLVLGENFDRNEAARAIGALRKALAPPPREPAAAKPRKLAHAKPAKAQTPLPFDELAAPEEGAPS